ncbi:MAG: FmdB family transcriptional regulator [Thermoleophilia bacterium]|nr:FmdB family transcriptional regulator [Thermoleophilia bacterium]
MPTYEYRCAACAHQFEVFARMSDPAPEACEACGAGPLTKVLFPVAVHYKGSGFYKTDYDKPKAAPAASGSSAGTDSSSSASESTGSSSSSEAASTGSASDSSAPAAPAKPAASDA